MGWRKFCGWALRKLGWTVVEGLPEEKKCIMLGVPHTTIWDFLIAYLYYKSIGGDALCMVKKELFFPPLGWILKAMGAIPVDRSNATSLVRSVIKQMEENEEFHLAIAPEGTRKAVRRWKTGFHTIAKAVDGCVVYAGYFDWGRKRVGIGERFPLTDDPRADLERLQAHYEAMGLKGKHDGQFLTH